MFDKINMSRNNKRNKQYPLYSLYLKFKIYQYQIVIVMIYIFNRGLYRIVVYIVYGPLSD